MLCINVILINGRPSSFVLHLDVFVVMLCYEIWDVLFPATQNNILSKRREGQFRTDTVPLPI